MKFPAARCGASKRNCVEAAPTFALKSLNAIHLSFLPFAPTFAKAGQLKISMVSAAKPISQLSQQRPLYFHKISRYIGMVIAQNAEMKRLKV